MKPTQKALQIIWEKINNGEYRNIARELPEAVIIAPKKLFSDSYTREDIMSLPNCNGTNRHYYYHRSKGKPWKETWKS